MYRERADVRTLRGKRRVKNTRVRKVLWRWFLCVSGLVFIFFGASWLSFLAPLQLEKIVLIGMNSAARREARAAEAAVARAFTGVGERLVSSTHTLFYPRRAILENIASSSPRIADTSATRGGRILVVAVAERAPFARWCTEGGSPCLFIDDTGFAFAPVAGDRTPTTPLIFMGGTPTAGTPFLSPAKFVHLRDTLASAARIGLSVVRASRGEGSDLSFFLVDGAETRFVLSVDTPALFLALPSTLSAAQLAIAEGSVAPPLQYVDLRFAEQVVFKRR